MQRQTKAHQPPLITVDRIEQVSSLFGIRIPKTAIAKILADEYAAFAARPDYIGFLSRIVARMYRAATVVVGRKPPPARRRLPAARFAIAVCIDALKSSGFRLASRAKTPEQTGLDALVRGTLGPSRIARWIEAFWRHPNLKSLYYPQVEIPGNMLCLTLDEIRGEISRGLRERGSRDSESDRAAIIADRIVYDIRSTMRNRPYISLGELPAEDRGFVAGLAVRKMKFSPKKAKVRVYVLRGGGGR